jgi:hypothetical protein
MKKYPLIGVSIIAVVLLVLGSLTNVVGFQTVQSSNQKVISDKVDQKEFLFQTILDIANNKEIQKIILKSQINRGRVFGTGISFSVFTPQVLTKKFLNNAYRIGAILSKVFSLSKMHSILERYQVDNQEVQKEISAVIEKDATLKREITQLSNSKCDCENDNAVSWRFPILCTFLLFLFTFAFILWIEHINMNLVILIGDIGKSLNCFWPAP